MIAVPRTNLKRVSFSLHDKLRVRRVPRLLDVAETQPLQERRERSVLARRHLERDQHTTNVRTMVAVVEQTHVPLRCGAARQQEEKRPPQQVSSRLHDTTTTPAQRTRVCRGSPSARQDAPGTRAGTAARAKPVTAPSRPMTSTSDAIPTLSPPALSITRTSSARPPAKWRRCAFASSFDAKSVACMSPCALIVSTTCTKSSSDFAWMLIQMRAAVSACELIR